MSEQEQLLEALAAAMKDEGAPGDEQRLDALTRGALSEDDLAELETRAQDEPRLAEALAAHSPVSAEAREGFFDAALDALGASPPETETAPTVQETRRGARVITMLLPLAVAAALAWLLLRPSPAPPLPGYQLTVLADASSRSQPPPSSNGEPITLSEGSRLRIVLRPERQNPGEVVARAVILEEGTQKPVPISPEVADTGAIKIEAERSALFGARRGDVVLRVVVGRPNRIEEGLTAGASQGDGWRRYDTPIRLPP